MDLRVVKRLSGSMSSQRVRPKLCVVIEGGDFSFEDLTAVVEANVRNVGLANVPIVFAQEVQLVAILPSALEHTISRDFTLVHARQLPHLPNTTQHKPQERSATIRIGMIEIQRGVLERNGPAWRLNTLRPAHPLCSATSVGHRCWAKLRGREKIMSGLIPGTCWQTNYWPFIPWRRYLMKGFLW